MLNVKRHLMTGEVKDNLIQVSWAWAYQNKPDCLQEKNLRVYESLLLGYWGSQSQLPIFHGLLFTPQQHGAHQTGVSQCNGRQPHRSNHKGRALAFGSNNVTNYTVGDWYLVSADRCDTSDWVSWACLFESCGKVNFGEWDEIFFLVSINFNAYVTWIFVDLLKLVE